MSKIPKFKSEKEEAEFWDTHSLTEFLDDLKEEKEPIFFRPVMRTLSIRLEDNAARRLRAIARDKGLHYTTLIRTWVMEKLKQEQPAKSTRS